jgi:hypothetical protein
MWRVESITVGLRPVAVATAATMLTANNYNTCLATTTTAAASTQSHATILIFISIRIQSSYQYASNLQINTLPTHSRTHLPAPGNLSPGMAGKVESVLHATNSTFSRAKYAVAIASLLRIGENSALL